VRLLIVTPWPLSTPGGGQRLAREIAGSLAADYGLDVLVAAGSGVTATPVVATDSAPFREVRLPLICRPGRDGISERGLFATACLQGLETLAAATRPDAILYGSHFSSCAVQAAALAQRLGIPVVLLPAIHQDHPLHTSRAARRFYRSADLVLCLSEIERAWLERRAGVTAGRLLTLGCGWHGSPAGRRPQRTTAERIQLLTVGGYARHKQLDHQVHAVDFLRHVYRVDARLTIAGALREPRVLESLRCLVRRRHLVDSVEFLTDCPDSAIAALYAESDYFVFTSRSESFGMAVLDAIGFATLPVVYPHPIYRVPVESSGFGSVARAASPKALAEAILRARDATRVDRDEPRLHWLGERSWRRVAAPLAEALERIRAPLSRTGIGTGSPPSAVMPDILGWLRRAPLKM